MPQLSYSFHLSITQLPPSPSSQSLHSFSIPIPSIPPPSRSLHPPQSYSTSPLLSHSINPSTTALPASLYFCFPSAHPYPSPIIPPLCPVPCISCLPPVNPSRLPHFLFATLLFYPAPFTLQYISNFSLPPSAVRVHEHILSSFTLQYMSNFSLPSLCNT